MTTKKDTHGRLPNTTKGIVVDKNEIPKYYISLVTPKWVCNLICDVHYSTS
jgi:hypothetical protein